MFMLLEIRKFTHLIIVQWASGSYDPWCNVFRCSYYIPFSETIMHPAERSCYIALIRSKNSEGDFNWPPFLSQDDRKVMRDRSRSLSLSESGQLLYQGKLVPTVTDCLDVLGDLHPFGETAGHSQNVRAHASVLSQKGWKLPAFLGGNQAAIARLVRINICISVMYIHIQECSMNTGCNCLNE